VPHSSDLISTIVLLLDKPVTSLAYQPGRRVFWEGPKFFKPCPTHFYREAKPSARPWLRSCSSNKLNQHSTRSRLLVQRT